MSMMHAAGAQNLDTLFSMSRIDAQTMAIACHETARVFLEESPFWGKAELAMWLLGPYSQLAQPVREDATSSRPTLRQIDETTIDGVMEAARAEVEGALAIMEDADGAWAVAETMIAKGFVAQTVDKHGVIGWAPTTSARRLADRVLSLFVATLLATPPAASVRLAA